MKIGGVIMPDIFDEMNMRQALDAHIPNETLLAGIHAISKEIDIKGTFGRCILAEDRLIPNPNGRIISLTKKNILRTIFTWALPSHFWLSPNVSEAVTSMNLMMGSLQTARTYRKFPQSYCLLILGLVFRYPISKTVK